MATVTFTPYSTHDVFYAEFLKIHKSKSEELLSLDERMLAVMFLHLALESLLTFLIRNAVHSLLQVNHPLIFIWQRRYEKGQLREKLEFLEDVFFTIVRPSDFDEICKYERKSSKTRNLIVHGHELAAIQISDGYDGGTVLHEFLTHLHLGVYHSEFKEVVERIFGLMGQIHSTDIRPGVDWSAFLNLLKAKFFGIEKSIVPA